MATPTTIADSIEADATPPDAAGVDAAGDATANPDLSDGGDATVADVAPDAAKPSEVVQDADAGTDALALDSTTDAFAADVKTDQPDGASDVPLDDGSADGAEDAGAETVGTDALSTDVAPACVCGDGVCASACGETGATCLQDCVGCGNGICEPGESPNNCVNDCCGACGDGKCVGYACGESPQTCWQDCGSACGNKTCDKGENPATCPEDCLWQACGNGKCEPADGGPDKCPQDCATACGDCKCEGGESFDSCPIDCGWCGDGVCSNCGPVSDPLGAPVETTATCANDCAPKECSPKYLGSQCNDAEPCTFDSCDASGVCHHDPIESVGLGIIATCTDDDVCTVGDHCQGGTCAKGKLPLDCDDGNSCTYDVCVAYVGCAQEATPLNGAECNDGDACTLGDACLDGACHGTSTGCDDGNACTIDSCTKIAGCIHAANLGALCDDGDACTLGDACVGTLCQKGATAKVCSDGNACTLDGCDQKQGCITVPLTGALCTDNNACTQIDTCISGACVGSTPLVCDDKNACTTDACDPAVGCTTTALDGATCDDGNVCTLGDLCVIGVCQKGTVAKTCDGANACTLVGCDPKQGCQSVSLSGTPCTDNNACTLVDTCVAGNCVGSSPLVCDDKNPCTSDACDPAVGCTTTNTDGTVCDDGNVCTIGDVCGGGFCVKGSVAKVCDDGNPCTLDACDPKQGCQTAPLTGTLCDDKNACTQVDTCLTGGCVGTTPLVCDDKNPCTTDGCDPAAGCTTTMANGTACTDNNACTSGEACAQGACTGGKAVSCNDNNDCTADSCNTTTGCAHATLDGTTCSDGSACTDLDKCVVGVCKGTPRLWVNVRNDTEDQEVGGAGTLSDGTVVVVGSVYLVSAFPSANWDALVTWTDKYGATMTSKTFGDYQNQKLYDVAIGPGDTAAVAGYDVTGSIFSASKQVTLRNLAQSGGLVWQYTSNISGDQFARGVAYNAVSKEYALVGEHQDSGASTMPMVAFVNPDGSEGNFAFYNEPNATLSKVIALSDGGFIAIGTTTNHNNTSGLLLMRLNSNYTINYFYYYTNGSYALQGYDIYQAADNTFFVTGNAVGSDAKQRGMILHYNNNGTVAGGPWVYDTGSFNNIVGLPSGNLLVGGRNDLATGTNNGAWLMRTDKWGALQSSVILGTAGTQDAVNGLAITADGLAAIGVRKQYGGPGDLTAIIADIWGNETCSASAGCFAQTDSTCTDSATCTADACTSGVCKHTPQATGTSCGASTKCTVTGTCL